jgi:hypothetical protein
LLDQYEVLEMVSMPRNKRQFLIYTVLVLIIVSSFSFTAYYIHQLGKPLEVTVKTGPIGQNRTLKDRMLFVVNVEKVYRKRGYLASFDLEGENGKTLIFFLEKMNRPMAGGLVRTDEFVEEIRDMGFRRLVLRNGKEEWDVDLKN